MSFFLTVIVSDLLAILFFVLTKTIAFVNVVEYYSVRVVLISSSRGCDASGCLSEP
jgi:hypothetical protein